MKKGMIIVGFATSGKSYLGRKYSNVIDIESSNYKYDNSKLQDIPVEQRKGMPNRPINKDWPNNYYKVILEATKEYDIVLVQLLPDHLNYFDKNNIKYSIAYPDINDWNFVEERCRKRGNNERFIERLKTVFIPFYENCLNRNYEKMFIITRDKTFEDCLLENNIELKKD